MSYGGVEFWETFLSVRDGYLATLLIGAVCAYLGLFTILRRIVFTGVALAQLAAAGVAASLFVESVGPAWLSRIAARYGATAGSLAAALGGVLTLEARREQRKIATDALVGALYAAAAAAGVLLVWRSAHGLAELRNLVAGDVLLSRQGELFSLWVGLPLVALVHFVYRRPFLLVSYDPEFARALGIREGRYQALLMGTLAVAIALSLRAGGLLLVFAFLVFPGVAALRVGRDLDEASWLAPALAVVASGLGFVGATALDLPVAPCVSLALLACAVGAWAVGSHPRLARVVRALTLGATGGALVLCVAAFLWSTPDGASSPEGPPPATSADDSHDHDHDHEHEHPHPAAIEKEHENRTASQWIQELEEAVTPQARADAALHLEDLGQAEALQPLLVALNDEAKEVRAAAGHAVACLTADSAVRAELASLAGGEDAELRALAGLGQAASGERHGVGVLVEALADEDVPLYVRQRALATLREINRGRRRGLDLENPTEAARSAGVASWRAWWKAVEPRLHWDPHSGGFRAPKN
jgi:ABC-type Mn2+/Zn2+ transport system permease subunit